MDQQPTIDESRSSAGLTQALGARVAGAMLRQDVLARAFADQVLPKLLGARSPAAPARAALSLVGAEEVERLLALVLTGTQAEALSYVAGLRERGLPDATILLDLLTPVARRLGQMWEDDTCTFSDVTIGTGHLAHVLRVVCDGCSDAACLRTSPRALLVQMPGEQHGFGLSMVAHFFRQDGWHVRQAPLATEQELIGLVREEWFGVVGISVACSDRLDALAGCIRALRHHARNPDLAVMVGGPPFLAHPQLASLVGADATATDGRQAVREAHRLLGLQARGR